MTALEMPPPGGKEDAERAGDMASGADRHDSDSLHDVNDPLHVVNDPLADITAPTHRDDPESSSFAARKMARRVRGEVLRVLQIIAWADRAGLDGITNREIQLALYDRAENGWNKVATRTGTLWRRGLVERLGTRLYNDQPFLAYRITEAGWRHLRGDLS